MRCKSKFKRGKVKRRFIVKRCISALRVHCGGHHNVSPAMSAIKKASTLYPTITLPVINIRLPYYKNKTANLSIRSESVNNRM
ncbi:hypothetical protein IX324_000670 [Bacteroides pyogenes]|nr:hypothetical protein [Bacteroides pyogenes]